MLIIRKIDSIQVCRPFFLPVVTLAIRSSKAFVVVVVKKLTALFRDMFQLLNLKK